MKSTVFRYLRQMKAVIRYAPLTWLAMASPSPADWTGLEGADSTLFEYFIDLSTLRKTQVGHEVFILQRAKTPEAPWQSVKLQLEANCSQRRIRTLFSTRYSGPMSTGTFDSKGDPSSWLPIAKGSVEDIVFKIACK